MQAVTGDTQILRDYACRYKEVKGKPLHVFPDQVKLYGIGMALGKGSLLTPKISERIGTYLEQDYIGELNGKWSTDGCPEREKILKQQADYRSFGGAFMMLIIGIAVSVVLMFLKVFQKLLFAKVFNRDLDL